MGETEKPKKTKFQKWLEQNVAGGSAEFHKGINKNENLTQSDVDRTWDVGDKVHLGFAVKGGTGFFGEIFKIAGDTVWIRNDQGKEYQGRVKNLTAMGE